MECVITNYVKPTLLRCTLPQAQRMTRTHTYSEVISIGKRAGSEQDSVLSWQKDESSASECTKLNALSWHIFDTSDTLSLAQAQRVPGVSILKQPR